MKQLKTTITILFTVAISLMCHVSAFSQTIQNDEFWHDTNGNPIYSQGGGVLKVGNTYYWYGAKYRGAETYYNNPFSGKNGDTEFLSITCYSSTDLANWTFEGDMITPAQGLQAGWVGRIGCAYNEPTGKYVLIAQMYPNLAFCTSDSPTGPFTLAATQTSIGNVVNDMTGDQSVFTDDDGQAYLAFCNVQGRNNQYVAHLRPSDYLYVEPATRIHRASSGREGNVLFKHNGTYYFISSDLHGWNTSQTYFITASNIYGPYSNEFVIQGTENDYSHVTQSGLAFSVNGSSGSFAMFGGDRWADFAGNGVGYNQWMPISFNGTTPIFHSLSQWNVNASAGTWSVGSGNNYILNPNIEADRINVTDVTGWPGWVDSGSNPNGNLQDSHDPGRFCLEQWSSSAYQAGMYQNISLPNGTYDLKAWVKSSGGQSFARIYAKNYGGSERRYSINQSIGSWTEISIPDIEVTNGSIEVGVYSNASGGQWINVDDFSLISTGGGNNCQPTAITAYAQVNGGSWQGSTNLTVNSGDEIKFGPQPVSGGSWSWSGCGTSGSSREQTIYPTSSCSATATFTNSCGTQSSVTFNITVQGNYYQIQNRATGLYLDGMGRTTNGDPCGQYANTTHVNSQWELIDTGDGYSQLKNRGTGLFLDGMGLTNNGADCGQYADTNHPNSHWDLQQYSGSYYRLQNRGTGLFLDGMGYTGNGEVVGQWANTTSQNAQWQLINVGSSARMGNEVSEPLNQTDKIQFYPNPANDVLNIQLENNDGSALAKIFNISGQVVLNSQLTEQVNSINIQDFQAGTYFIEVRSTSGINRFKLIKQ
ncbi:RICIN domain-containing protein [Reichenbachiella ulvae]|uniref:RICIN domain-containing protein n=1 Tax=Reichenbachiella ulvae TaxID=2980104 RepID=A0ABT3CUG8_9BACT|nr:RICIN domain-containing protein [Reichenbachiella ulvae]MCV9387342.1 RICIN domain-containing protein [Reichenbachiella ulvae]